ncbi:MAG: hypothetical protein HOE80_00510 [Candidatus Magasanikbacteria bacterium]|jgi:hypothetical protein|nr:hypothetical protein [Candidatus Magasanikbacteria bacterium]MBT4071193.1 hypothetical protein [Candidatus Magasanikbacteria bacterium]
MHKILTVLLSITLLTVISGCGQKDTIPNQNNTIDLSCVSEPGASYFQGTEQCCEGLKGTTYSSLPDGTCVLPKDDMTSGAGVCIPCGNNICEKEFSENECNCPEDCATK